MAKKASTTKQAAEVPSILAFNRKIEPSDALLQAGCWSSVEAKQFHGQEWRNIEVYEKRNRGTKSQYGVAEEEKADPNLAWIDDAALFEDTDTLRVAFTLKFLGDVAKPTANNRPEFAEKLSACISAYQADVGYAQLALRYANNIANGRFLWRNRVGAENIVVVVQHQDKQWVFNSYDFALNDFSTDTNSDLAELAAVITQALSTSSFALLHIVAFAQLGHGQHVFPSQEMVLDIPKGQKSRHLYQLKTTTGKCAAMHSEKIGNAIRTIDTWYQVGGVPIAIEPYGSAPSQGEAYRSSKIDFYSLLIKWLKEDETIAVEDQHFVVANLIRGGVFGGNDE
ncbi:type I-F CRISPR-associated protein Csy3 [Vitreoscilla massiliensis]|uniref:Type I-F CRISPR-associated protein Csy3 n=1 Tax=Vitreoscilla massiliensis TaxID=1689272 RepID=A0ABY4DZB6_9NEIS|nr:type I-F CRISPR-associated protein Csy3 [Vitreoscilla massiliensis]UOO88882.1 type I-F CRISPR-associated protein Csy3 [Vitreoscilla massiliensis]